MAYKVKINEKEYDLKDGFIFKEELNETLDSATINFNAFNSDELDAESFDKAVIYDTENKIEKKHLLVDSCDDEIYSFNENQNDHTYTMLLFSQTKELERITLPNCTITQPIIEGIAKKTVWDEIKRFCELYIPKIRIYASSGHTKQHKYKIDSEVKTRFETITCPEFQWNNPTLREVLTDLMSVDDCIPIIKQNVISFLDLKNINESSNQIDISKINYSKKSFGSSDYIGELTLPIKNGISANKTIVCEKKSLRSEDATLTTENAIFTTQHPIYNIISCKISYYYVSAIQTSGSKVPVIRYQKDVDITRFIVEEGIFNIANSGRYDGNDVNTALGYKHYLIKYKRGENKLENWGKIQKSNPTIFSSSISTIGWIARILNKAEEPGEVVYDTAGLGNGFCGRSVENHPNIFGIAVDLTYETLSETSMHVGKYLPNKHSDNRIFDNQSSSYVDINHQSIFEYAKANRLGNKIREIHGVYSKESDVPTLGDKINNEVLFSRELHYFDEYIEFIGYLTENYVLRNYFTGVNAKRRSYQLAFGDEALTRTEIIKYYFECSSYLKKSDNDFHVFDIQEFTDGLLADLIGTSKLNYCLVSMTDNDGVYYPTFNKMYQIDNNKSIQGYSLCFNVGFTDNVAVDTYVKYISDENLYKSYFYKYCDNNGETQSFDIAFADYIDPADGEFVWQEQYEHEGAVPDEIKDKMLLIHNKICAKPLVKRQNIKHDKSFSIKKDNRETMRFALQFEYCSDTKDIVITPEFIKRCSAFGSKRTRAKVYMDLLNSRYNLNDTKALGSVNSDITYTTNVENDYSISISFTFKSNIDLRLMGCVGLADESGNLLIGINKEAFKNGLKIYINMLDIRDCNVYYSVDDQFIVGTISDSQETLDNNYNNHTQETSSVIIRKHPVSVDSFIQFENEQPALNENGELINTGYAYDDL